jgi:hypothetical protein
MKSKPRNKHTYDLHVDGKQKVLKKNYHVTSQTAYHITQLALEENTSEGRIIDKLMRNYLASRGHF